MLDLRPNAGLQSFYVVVYRIDRILQIQLSSLAGPHPNMPPNRTRLLALFDALVSGVGINTRFLPCNKACATLMWCTLAAVPTTV
jgi:hypothetical protein